MAGKMERRSSRQRKTVDYRKLQDVGSDDDDFADLPPSKKAKTSSKTTQKEQLPSKAEPPKAKRLSREEKMYHRAIEQALKQSTTKSDDNVESDNEFVPSQSSEAEDSFQPSDDSDFHSSPAAAKKEKKKTVSKGSTKNSPLKKSATKTTDRTETKPPVKSEKNDISSVTTETATPNSQKMLTPAALSHTPSTNSKASAAQCQQTLRTDHERPTVHPATPINAHSRTPTLSKRTPKWTPPAQVGKGSVQSPTFRPTGSPAIRLGLSRNARVKSLHGRTPK